MDRLDELAVFVAILDEGTLAGAARRLRRSPPAVTRVLAGLEERLGVRLVERSTRRLAATPAGLRLLAHARRLLGDFEDAMRDAAGDAAAPRGTLRLTAPLLFGRMHVAPLLLAFLDAHPAVSAELLLADRPLDLIEEGIDVALRIGHLADSGLIARRVGEVRRLLVASPAYLAARGVPASPADLDGHEAVFFADPGAPPEWRFHGPQGERTVRVAARFRVNQADAVLAAVRDGRGIAAALSYQVAADLAAGTLVRLLREHEMPALPVHLVTPSARLPPPRTRAFLDFATPRLAALPVLRQA